MNIGELASLIRSRADALDHPMVVGISGYGGSGKSTLARALIDRIPGADRIRGDDFLDPDRSHRRSTDWDGVERARLANEVLIPFRERRPSTFRRFDWTRGALGKPEPIPEGDIVIVDLIGLFHPSVLDTIDLTIWCDVDIATAQTQGMRRDAELGRDHSKLWTKVWVPNELDFDARFAPRDRAEIRFEPQPH